MQTNRFAPPDAPARDAPPEADSDASRGRSIAELSQVVANAMAHFDKLRGACAPDRGGGLSGAAQRDISRRSSNFVLIRLGSGALLFGGLIAVRATFAETAAVCALVMVVTGLSLWRQHRRASVRALDAVLAMPEPLRAVATRIAELRLALPPSHGQLAEALETIEARMARVFNGADDALATALLKLSGKVFGYAGFDRLAEADAAIAAPLGSLNSAISQALQGRAVAAAG